MNKSNLILVTLLIFSVLISLTFGSVLLTDLTYMQVFNYYRYQAASSADGSCTGAALAIMARCFKLF